MRLRGGCEQCAGTMVGARALLAALLVALLVALLAAPPAAADDTPTHDPLLFEAAFQGRCGAGSPCEQLCRELHDGTYECGCKPGYLLNVDGYSCQELNSTSRIFDLAADEEEDVLYQKDATFSAELDVAFLPSNTINKPKPKLPDVTDLYTFIENKHKSKHIDRKPNDSTTELPKYISNINAQDFNYNISDSGEMFKQIEGLNSLISEGISRKDINMITDDKTRLDEDVTEGKGQITTQGPSLEQKVPGATSSPRWTAAVGSAGEGGCACGAGCGDSVRCLCPLGRTGPKCQHEARISSPRFGGDSWLALPALRGAYKRVRLRVRVRPERARGVLLLTGERDDLTGDYLALLLRDGHVELRFDCGSGAGVLRSPEPVHLGRWNTISVYRHRWDARLRLNAGARVRGRSKGLFSRMTFREPVWVGGGGNTTGLPQKLALSDGLVGCLDFLRINGHTYHLVQDALAGADVAECAPTPPPWQFNEISTTSQISSDHSRKIENTIHGDEEASSIGNVVYSDHATITDSDHSRAPFRDNDYKADNELSNNIVPSDFGSLRYANTDTVLRDADSKFNKVMAKVYDNNVKKDIKYSESDKNTHSNEENSVKYSDKVNVIPKIGRSENSNSVEIPVTARSEVLKSDSDESCTCAHGGACVRGVCLCPLGYAGDSCEITLDLKVPRFNGSSYLRLPGLGNSALSWLDIQITLKATSGTGLLMYNADRASGAGDFFSLQLRDYFVEFAYDLGSGIALVRSAFPLRPDTWHRVAVSRSGRRAQLRMWLADDSGVAVSSVTRSVTSLGPAMQLELRQPLMLGGAPHPLPPRLALSASFSGCIRQLIINEEELSVVASALGGVNVDNCEEPHSNNTCSPTQKSCKGNLEVIQESPQNYTSDSIHHSIVAKKGFKLKHLKSKPRKKNHTHSERYRLKKHLKMKKNQYHRQMERSNEIVTEGPSEPNYQNLYNDETYMQVKYMNTNEIHWSDANSYPSFTGKDSFIHIDDSETMKRLLSYTLDINIRFKSMSSDGLLVWSGRNNMQPGDDFLSLAIENSMLVFRYDLGSGEVVIIANHTVDDGLWHRARATRNRQAGVLEVDGLGSVGKVSPGKLKQLNTENGLYIGGLPSISSNTHGKYTSGIEGCISQISLFGDFDIPLSLNKLPHTITNNVGRCLP